MNALQAPNSLFPAPPGPPPPTAHSTIPNIGEIPTPGQFREWICFQYPDCPKSEPCRAQPVGIDAHCLIKTS